MDLENVTGFDYEDMVTGIYLCRYGREDWALLSFDNGFCHLGTNKSFGLDPIEAYGPIE